MDISRLTEEDADILMGRQTLPLKQVQAYRDADRADANIMMRAQYYKEAQAVAPNSGQFTLAHQVRSKLRADRA